MEKCHTSYKEKCHTVYHTAYDTKYEKKCKTDYEKKCHTGMVARCNHFKFWLLIEKPFAEQGRMIQVTESQKEWKECISDHTWLHKDYKIVYDKKCKPVYHEKVILLILFFFI